MTLQQAAQQAMDVQDACNLSGIVRSFDRIVQEVLKPEAERLGKGIEWVNEHPISKLFIDKFASLARTQYNLPGDVAAVTMAFSDALTNVLWPLAHDGKLGGTTAVNQHPISQMFVAILQGLAKTESSCLEFSHAWDKCEDLAKAKTETPA